MEDKWTYFFYKIDQMFKTRLFLRYFLKYKFNYMTYLFQ